jgi:hypothetical protein
MNEALLLLMDKAFANLETLANKTKLVYIDTPGVYYSEMDDFDVWGVEILHFLQAENAFPPGEYEEGAWGITGDINGEANSSLVYAQTQESPAEYENDWYFEGTFSVFIGTPDHVIAFGEFESSGNDVSGADDTHFSIATNRDGYEAAKAAPDVASFLVDTAEYYYDEGWI